LTKENAAAAKALGAFGQVKHLDNVRARFIVVDGKHVVAMPLDDKETHSNYDFGIWLNTKFYAQGMDSMFEMLWEKAK
jgi:hypothetical protein